jgi:hypothetical protein
MLIYFLFWTASLSILYSTVSSPVILRMLLSIAAESRHVPFKVLNRQKTACTERTSAKIHVSSFCFSLFRDYPLATEEDNIVYI